MHVTFLGEDFLFLILILIPMNAPDRCRFFDIARGSALECAAALDVLAAKGRLEMTLVNSGKERLRRIVSMLVGLIKANSDYRLHEGD